ncbi:MAG: hypothetical protein A3G77_07120 [Acidobacteria bacterium RIFCSPLOWO2_12_FULL_68_19]|nr:MAG: hypothetical protein A3G77_07120 [Acidobacteria bacterium RIFCSPLOWO2_12_FULL_68_19]
MLRTNLSTRPFYNLRAVRIVLGAGLLVVAGLTVFNVGQLARLAASQYTLGARAAAAEREADRLRTEAAGIRAQINPQELQVVASAAREANAIIDQRAFSWTDLLAQFEVTLPPDVRVTTIQPRLERAGDFIVAIGVEARRAEDLDAFIEALETRGGFRNVLSIQEQANTAGLIQAVIEGAYLPPPRTPPGAGEGR